MTNKELLKLLSNSAVIISVIVAIIILFIKSKKSGTKTLKFYFVAIGVFEVWAYIAAKMKGNNHFLYPIYAIFDLSTISLFYYFVLKEEIKKPKLLRVLYWISGSCLIILIYNLIFLKRVDLGMTFTTIPILIYCFYMFYLMLENKLEEELYLVFIVLAFLTHGVSFLIYGLNQTIFSLNLDQQINIYIIRTLVLLTAKGFILVYILNKVFNKNLFLNG